MPRVHGGSDFIVGTSTFHRSWLQKLLEQRRLEFLAMFICVVGLAIMQSGVFPLWLEQETWSIGQMTSLLITSVSSQLQGGSFWNYAYFWYMYSFVLFAGVYALMKLFRPPSNANSAYTTYFYEQVKLVYMDDLWKAASNFVFQSMQQNDASHDMQHIERVVGNAIRIAERESGPFNLQLVLLSAVLHDVDDWKYSSTSEGAQQKPSVRAFLAQHSIPADRSTAIIDIISSIGFKEELGGDRGVLSPEALIVQDADRLDAIGAIGIARAFTFGGARNRALYANTSLHTPHLITKPSQGEYSQKHRQTDTLAHFYEKLFHLPMMMKTISGRSIAEERSTFMTTYVTQLRQEVFAHPKQASLLRNSGGIWGTGGR